MPDIQSEKERLYESSSLRDDLPDEPATVLLEWGEGQVERLAEDFPDELEQKARFLRQVIKNINRFVGQREYNDAAGQADYMNKVVMYLPELGWDDVSQDDLMASLPHDATDLMANTKAILNTLTPPNLTAESGDMLTAGGGGVATFGATETVTSLHSPSDEVISTAIQPKSESQQSDDSAGGGGTASFGGAETVSAQATQAEDAIEVVIEPTEPRPISDNPAVDGIGDALGTFVGNIVSKAVESMGNAQQADDEPNLLENSNSDSINQPDDTQTDEYSDDDEGITFDD